MKIRSVMPVCFVALALSASAAAHEVASKKTMTGHSMEGHSAGSMELHRIMAKGHSMSMPMSGDVDKDFATMMTMHHQQAVAMSDVLIRTGKNPELKAMAQKMKSDQTAEIRRLAKFAGPIDHGKMQMGQMDHGKMKMGDMDHGKMKMGDMDNGKMGGMDFSALDKNRDGKLTKGEIPASNPLAPHFGMIDANKDGSLSEAEFAKHHDM